jgi:glycosyltransferase involved in cell wall biosynthesis
MRLGIVNHHGRTPGGAEIGLMLQLDELPNDIEPHLFLFEEGAFADAVRARYGNVTVVEMSASIAASTRTRPTGRAFIETPILARRLAVALRGAEVDLVLTNSMKAHVVGSLAARLAGIPCVNYLHDVPTGFARFVVRESSRLFARERIACSQATARNLGLDRTSVLYTPLRLAAYRPLPDRASARARLGLPDDGRPLVSLVGRIARWKGHERFIDIAARVRTKIDAHFAIVGSPVFGCDPDFVPELHALVAAHGAADRIHFMPWRDDLRDVFAASDLCCNCSDREPFGRTMLEAMACGVPVVCFDDAGACEAFGGGGGVGVAERDHVAFARAIVTLLGDGARHARASEAAQRGAERFDIAHLAQPFRTILYRAAAPRGPLPHAERAQHAASRI